MNRSARITLLAYLLAIAGGASLLLDLINGTMVPDKSLLGVWVTVCGIGLYFHNRWAFYLLASGTLVLILGAFINTLYIQQNLMAALQAVFVIAVIYGIPNVIVWTRRDRLLPQSEGGADA